jgi:hypothetical protein
MPAALARFPSDALHTHMCVNCVGRHHDTNGLLSEIFDVAKHY